MALGAMGLLIHPAEAAPQDAGPPPDADFLEFLGSWHTGDGKWNDPFQEDESPILETSEPSPSPASRDSHDQSGIKRSDQEPTTSENQPASPRPRREVTP